MRVVLNPSKAGSPARKTVRVMRPNITPGSSVNGMDVDVCLVGWTI
jgi:hypothetical protein